MITLMLFITIASFALSSRLAWVFYRLMKNAKNKKVLPLAKVLCLKSTLFALMTALISIELMTFKLISQSAPFVRAMHWHFGFIFVLSIFIGQLYLFNLVEMRDNWTKYT